MEKLMNISQFICLLFHDEEFSSTMTQYMDSEELILSELKNRFINIDDYNLNDLVQQIQIRNSTINELKDESGEFLEGYKTLISQKIYGGFYFHNMHSDDKKSDRRAGMGCRIDHFEPKHRELVSYFLAELNKKVLNNELKNYEQAEQVAILFIDEVNHPIKRN